MRDGAIGAARTSSPRRERHVCLQVENQRKGFVDPPHLIDGQEADRLGEAVEIDGRKLVAHDQGLAISDGHWRPEARACPVDHFPVGV